MKVCFVKFDLCTPISQTPSFMLFNVAKAIIRLLLVSLQLKSTLEVVACQQWVRNQCSQQPSRRLLDTDMLGEKYLMPSQARYLFLLLCPYSNGGDPSRLSKNDPNSALEHILKVKGVKVSAVTFYPLF